jgi:hypothetical protein
MVQTREFDAPFCPLHKQLSPCLTCLLPEVSEIVVISHEEYEPIEDGVLFQEIDLNCN